MVLLELEGQQLQRRGIAEHGGILLLLHRMPEEHSQREHEDQGPVQDTADGYSHNHTKAAVADTVAADSLAASSAGCSC